MGSGIPKSLFRLGTGDGECVPRMSDSCADSDEDEGISSRWQRFIDLGGEERVPCVPDLCPNSDEDGGVSSR